MAKQLNESELNEFLKKNILNEIGFKDQDENEFDGSDIYNHFEPHEFDGAAGDAARQDIEKEHPGEFRDIGDSEFDKGITKKSFKDNVSRANLRLPSDERENQKLQQQLDVRKKHNKMFGKGSLNEYKETSDITHPFYIKDAEGNAIKMTNTVKHLATGAIGFVERLGEDASNNPVVYVEWTYDTENGTPNYEVRPSEIIVTQSRGLKKEAIQDIVKYPNMTSDNSLREVKEILKLEKMLLESTLSENEPTEDLKKKQGLMTVAGFPFVVYFVRDEHKGFKIQFIPSTMETLEKIDMVGRDKVAEDIKEEIMKMGVSNPTYNPNDEAAGIVFLTNNPKFNVFGPGGKPHDMKYDFSQNEVKMTEKEKEKVRDARKGARRDSAVENGDLNKNRPKVIPDKTRYSRHPKHKGKDL